MPSISTTRTSSLINVFDELRSPATLTPQQETHELAMAEDRLPLAVVKRLHDIVKRHRHIEIQTNVSLNKVVERTG